MQPVVRVLFVLPSLNGGGAERVVLNLLRNLDSTRFRATLFLLRREGTLFSEVPRQVRLVVGTERGHLRFNLPMVLARLLVEARRSDAIVGSLELTASYLAQMAGLATRKPVVGWVHTSLPNYLAPLPRWQGRLARAFYRRLQNVVLPGEHLQRELLQWLGTPSGLVTVIENPFDLAAYRTRGEAPLLGLEAVFERPTVVAVGRLIPAKGFDILIRAHAQLARRGVDHHLLIVGEGEERPRLEALRRELKVEATCFLPGRAENPLPLIKQATVFALSSRYEGFGMVLLEAMAAGTPIVATDCPKGPREVLEGGRTGMLVQPENVEALTNAIEHLLASPSARDRLSRLGSERVRHYDAKRIALRWQSLIEELVRQRRG
jgi:glycosyltransferase involved in cell wall biosynthesis